MEHGAGNFASFLILIGLSSWLHGCLEWVFSLPASGSLSLHEGGVSWWPTCGGLDEIGPRWSVHGF